MSDGGVVTVGPFSVWFYPEGGVSQGCEPAGQRGCQGGEEEGRQGGWQGTHSVVCVCVCVVRESLCVLAWWAVRCTLKDSGRI